MQILLCCIPTQACNRKNNKRTQQWLRQNESMAILPKNLENSIVWTISSEEQIFLRLPSTDSNTVTQYIVSHRSIPHIHLWYTLYRLWNDIAITTHFTSSTNFSSFSATGTSDIFMCTPSRSRCMISATTTSGPNSLCITSSVIVSEMLAITIETILWQ